MKKLDIIQFTPVIGGETTLTKSMYKILSELGYSVRIIHPSKSGKKLKDWETFDGQLFVKLSDFQSTIEDTDYVFFINSVHLKKHKKTEDRIAVFNSILPIFSFEGKNVIFYEHGRHSSDLYDYPTIFKKLKSQNNKIAVFTNTKDVHSYYKNLGYDPFLIRQPFDPENYPELSDKKSDSPNDIVNICFNSRYTANKRPQSVLPFFSKYLGKDANFKLNFRGNVRDNCSVWYDLFGYFEDSKIVMNGYADKPYQIYENQDYCLYAGYTTKSEKGKIEYAMLEPFYYGIPLIVEKGVIEDFRYEEYGIPREKFLRSVICLTEDNLESIINGTFDYKPYVKNAQSIVEDFLPDMIKSRLKIGLDFFETSQIENKTKNHIPLF